METTAQSLMLFCCCAITDTAQGSCPTASSPLSSPLLRWREAPDSTRGAGPADEAGRVMLPDTPGLGK